MTSNKDEWKASLTPLFSAFVKSIGPNPGGGALRRMLELHDGLLKISPKSVPTISSDELQEKIVLAMGDSEDLDAVGRAIVIAYIAGLFVQSPKLVDLLESLRDRQHKSVIVRTAWRDRLLPVLRGACEADPAIGHTDLAKLIEDEEDTPDRRQLITWISAERNKPDGELPPKQPKIIRK